MSKVRESINHSLYKTSATVIPLAVASELLMILSYIIDIVAFEGVGTLGETAPIANIMHTLGVTLQSAVMPLVSSGAAYYIGGAYAVPSGLIGGIMVQRGISFYTPSGNSGDISGLFGAMVTGLFAGGVYLVAAKLFTYISKGNKAVAAAFASVFTLLLTISLASTIGSLSGIISFLTSALLTLYRELHILSAVLLGIMVTADLYGPLYLSAHLFAVASLSLGDASPMAVIMSAAMVAPLSLGLSAIIFKGSFTGVQRLSAISGILCGVGGVSVCAVPQYLAHPVKSLAAFVPGGIVSALLTRLFGCSCEATSGGLLAIGHIHRPLYLALAVVCGVLISTALTGLVLSPSSHREQAVGTPRISKTALKPQ